MFFMEKNMTENPLTIMQDWLKNEEILSKSNPNRVVLSTCTRNCVPHSRVVAIRKITSDGLIFFTQLQTQKVCELKDNNQASLALWLAAQQAQIILNGYVVFLSDVENLKYWNENSRLQQLRFSSYAPTSGQPIESNDIIEEKYKILEKEYVNREIPMSKFYCGIEFVAESISTYFLRSDKFSDYHQYTKVNNGWEKVILSP